MKITIIGSGYVGLVTGACLAEAGHDVSCIDLDKKKVSGLKKSLIPFFEPGLSNIVKKAQRLKKLRFSSSYTEGLNGAEAIFLCVGTPPKKNGDPDLSFLKKAIKSIYQELDCENKAIIPIFIKSTVPVGTNLFAQKYLKSFVKNTTLVFASNPEFLKEGDAVNDFKNPDRIIIGSEDKKVIEISQEIYKNFSNRSKLMQFTSIESAELIKYASNAFLATKISFINEMSRICDKVGADIEEIKMGMGADTRIGDKFLNAGIGFGGSCFPKDLDGLIYNFQVAGIKPAIPSATKKANSDQLNYFYKKIKSTIDLKNSSLLVWGLSFKPNTDDIRESVSVKLIKKLSRDAAEIYVYDPVAMKNAKNELKGYKNIKFSKSKYSSINKCDALILATEWPEFKNPKTSELKKLKTKTIFDGRNYFEIKRLKNQSIKYIGVGKSNR